MTPLETVHTAAGRTSTNDNVEPNGSPVLVVAMLILASAAATIAALLPLSKFGDANLFDAGELQTALIVGPVVLMFLAALTLSSSRAMAGLGGGAALALASVIGSVSTAIWSSSDGEGLGAGATMLIVATILSISAATVALANAVGGPRNAAHVLAFVAVVLMCAGVTLVPDEAAGVSWSDWNYFSDYYEGLFTLSVHLLVWAPAVAALLGLVKGGRAGALFGLAGSVVLGWAVADTALADPYSAEYRTAIHPLAAIAAVAALVLYVLALTIKGVPPATGGNGHSEALAPVLTGGESTHAHPARWASDPFGRHSHRYWNGQQWTDQVADNGVASNDPPVANLGPVTHDPSGAAVALVAPQIAAMPAADVVLSLVPSADLDATIRRPAAPASYELILDTGQRIVLAGPIIIGRAPRARASEPTATLLPIADETMSVSATHLIVGPDPQGAWVEDIGSTNGSEVVDSAGGTTSIGPGVRVRVPAGSTLRFGDRSALLVSRR